MGESPDPPEPVAALLIVDAQAGLLDGASAVPSAAGVAARLSELLGAARAAGALVVHLQNDGPPGAPDEPGTPGWRIHASATPRPGEPVLRKSVDDGFDGTGLDEVLASARVRRLAVAGLQSEMCVERDDPRRARARLGSRARERRARNPRRRRHSVRDRLARRRARARQPGGAGADRDGAVRVVASGRAPISPREENRGYRAEDHRRGGSEAERPEIGMLGGCKLHVVVERRGFEPLHA